MKSSEGFRLHKAVVRFVYNVPTVTECERMCHAESKFRCVTYSYRYSPLTRDNCLLCDRPLGHLDYYSDIEPDRDYDIYAMADDPQMCQAPAIIDPHSRQTANARKLHVTSIPKSNLNFLAFQSEKLIRSFYVHRMLLPCNRWHAFLQINCSRFTERSFGW